MTYKIKVSSSARSNIREAVAYYRKNVSVKVAQNFIKDYELSLHKIIKNPFFQVYYKDFHGLPLKKFPYVIFYQINTERKLILINAVFHASQNIQKRPK